MINKKSYLSRFLTWSAKMAGNPAAFVSAICVVIIWVIIGIFKGFDSTWLLILDTIATINASLMVFIIQNTQYRESKALHLKIDELIRVTKEAGNELISIEEREEEELDQIRKQLMKKINKRSS